MYCNLFTSLIRLLENPDAQELPIPAEKEKFVAQVYTNFFKKLTNMFQMVSFWPASCKMDQSQLLSIYEQQKKKIQAKKQQEKQDKQEKQEKQDKDKVIKADSSSSGATDKQSAETKKPQSISERRKNKPHLQTPTQIVDQNQFPLQQMFSSGMTGHPLLNISGVAPPLGMDGILNAPFSGVSYLPAQPPQIHTDSIRLFPPDNK
jgi:hypothetical protein